MTLVSQIQVASVALDHRLLHSFGNLLPILAMIHNELDQLFVFFLAPECLKFVRLDSLHDYYYYY